MPKRRSQYPRKMFPMYYRNRRNMHLFMNYHRSISPDTLPNEIAIKKYKENNPIYLWSILEQDSVLSGRANVKPLIKNVNICLRDESTKEHPRMWFTIEMPIKMFTVGMFIEVKNKMRLLNELLNGPTPDVGPYRFQQLNKNIKTNILCESVLPMRNNVAAMGFFFEKNHQTGNIDMIYREKYYHGQEHMIVYRDCKYFGIDYEIIQSQNSDKILKESKFVISNDWQDKAIGTGINLYHREFQDFYYIVEMINNFIQSHQRETADHVPVAIPCAKIVAIDRNNRDEDGNILLGMNPHHTTPIADVEQEFVYVSNVQVLP